MNTHIRRLVITLTTGAVLTSASNRADGHAHEIHQELSSLGMQCAENVYGDWLPMQYKDLVLAGGWQEDYYPPDYSSCLIPQLCYCLKTVKHGYNPITQSTEGKFIEGGCLFDIPETATVYGADIWLAMSDRFASGHLGSGFDCTGHICEQSISEDWEFPDCCENRSAYHHLGRVCHLIQDMTSPPHIHPQNLSIFEHGDFETWGYDIFHGNLGNYISSSPSPLQPTDPLPLEVIAKLDPWSAERLQLIPTPDNSPASFIKQVARITYFRSTFWGELEFVNEGEPNDEATQPLTRAATFSDGDVDGGVHANTLRTMFGGENVRYFNGFSDDYFQITDADDAELTWKGSGDDEWYPCAGTTQDGHVIVSSGGSSQPTDEGVRTIGRFHFTHPQLVRPLNHPDGSSFNDPKLGYAFTRYAWQAGVRYNAGLILAANRRMTIQASASSASVQLDRADNLGMQNAEANPAGFNRYFVDGTSVSITAAATDSTGAAFSSWLKDGQYFSSSPSINVIVNAASVYLAVYGPSMVLVPSGPFRMGDTFNNEGDTDERPVHDVSLSSYYIDKFEVTNQQYADALNWARAQNQISVTSGGVVVKPGTSIGYCDTTTSSPYSRIVWNQSTQTFSVTPTKANHPMVMVSWYGAVAYCNWRSAMDGRQLCFDLSPLNPTWICDFTKNGYRPPTEAEWEKAAAWDPALQRKFRFGEHSDGCGYNCLDGHRANYLSSGDPFETGAEPRTTPVGYYDGTTHGSYATQDARSYYGCYDMSGNVWEWCYDWYGSYPSTPQNNPAGPASGTGRLPRGGSWLASVGANLRAADRPSLTPDYRLHHGGFRCAASAPSDMVQIPAGTFQMGDSFGEGGADELPLHSVFLSSYHLDRFEVTNQQFAGALNWAKSQNNLITVTNGVVYKLNSGTSFPYCSTTSASSAFPFSGDKSRIIYDAGTGLFSVVAGKENHPMTLVTWYGAAAYCNWRSTMEGRVPSYNLSDWTCSFGAGGYRLPTEAEWEKAARGGSGSLRYPWGNGIAGSDANYLGSGDPFETEPNKTTPVGYYDGSQLPQGPDRSNGFGLYDMAGDVWEWCNDWYSASGYPSAPQSNPTGPASGTARVFRGGAWDRPVTSPNDLRCANRNFDPPGQLHFVFGFRGLIQGIDVLDMPAGLTSLQFTSVCNTGNEGENSGFGNPPNHGASYSIPRICGSVGHPYRMGIYEITTSQYCRFLNAVAATDTYGLYNTNMANIGSSVRGCNIQRSGAAGIYTYAVGDELNWGNRPVNWVSWGDAARFVNWIANGQPTGLQGPGTTETGTYTLNGATSSSALMAVVRSSNARYVLPNEDEWYKAAYHKNNGITGDYWDYPTSSDTVPNNGNPGGDTGNTANYYDGDFSVGSPYYRSNVGSFSSTLGPYGTYDQGGNVWEWIENSQPFASASGPPSRGWRGSSYREIDFSSYMRAVDRLTSALPDSELNHLGFRIADLGGIPAGCGCAAPPSPPTLVSANPMVICPGTTQSILLTAEGGTGDTLRWFEGTCGGTSIGTTNPLSIPAPNLATTYYARRERTGCPPSACLSVTVTISGDGDGDGVFDCADNCPGTPAGELVNAQGCSCSQLNCDDNNPCTLDNCNSQTALCVHTSLTDDADGDGVYDCLDVCPNTPVGQHPVDALGCSCTQASQLPSPPDGDNDSVTDACDNCQTVSNTGQADCDHNGVGDACEPGAVDCDASGVPDSCEPPMAINVFIDVLMGIDLDPVNQCFADANRDGIANGLDVQPYVLRLLGG